MKENNLKYIPPKTKKSLQKGTMPKVTLLFQSWILRAFQIGVREFCYFVASLQTFCCSFLGSQGLSPVYAFVNSNPPGSASRCHKGVEKQPEGGEKTGQHLCVTYPLRTGSCFFSEMCGPVGTKTKTTWCIGDATEWCHASCGRRNNDIMNIYIYISGWWFQLYLFHPTT